MNVKRDYCLVSRRLSCNAFCAQRTVWRYERTRRCFASLVSPSCIASCFVTSQSRFTLAFVRDQPKCNKRRHCGGGRCDQVFRQPHSPKKWGFTTASNLLYFIILFWERYICMYQFFIGNTSCSLRRYLTTLFSNDSASLSKPMPTQYRVTLAPLRKPYRIGLVFRHTNGNFRPISVPPEAAPRWSRKEIFTGRIGFWAHFSWHREQEVFIVGQSIFHVNMISYPV